MSEKNWQRILLTCKVCGETFWTETDINTYVFSSNDLICDKHYDEDGELIENVKEQVLDEEDTNFLEDLIEELPKIDNGVYKTEAIELENILYRLVKN